MLPDSVMEYFRKHQEQAFICKAFATIFLIIWLREFLSGLIFIVFLLFPVFFLIYIRLQSATTGQSPYAMLKEHITFMPFMRTEGERKKEETPWVTYNLVLVNILIFYAVECNPMLDTDAIIKNLVFLPWKPNLWNAPLAGFASMFLHGSGGHLWGNMLFLWMFGSVVERRIGMGKFLLLYLITGLLAGITYVLVHFLFLGEVGHVLGASGAIAGIMGIFAVRCYFKSMVFPLPILGIFSLILPISLKVRLNSLVVMGLFFLADLSGGIGQVSGAQISHVAHWAHIGGMLGGMALAGLLGLNKGAIEERHLEIGIKAANKAVGSAGGEESLLIALKENPNNAEALLHLARIKSKFTATEEARALYERAMELLAPAKPQDASAVFKEYFGKYHRGVKPQLMYRLAGILYKQKEHDTAARCLEMLANAPDTPLDIRERAMYQCAVVLEEIGLFEAAEGFYKLFVQQFPNSAAVAKVKVKLGIA